MKEGLKLVWNYFNKILFGEAVRRFYILGTYTNDKQEMLSVKPSTYPIYNNKG